MTNFEVDLSNCDREPVHIPGHVQPHGALLAVDPRKLIVEQVSANVGAFLGEEPDAFLGRPLAELLGGDLATVQRLLLEGNLEGQARHLFSRTFGERRLDVLGHLHDDVLLLELEPAEHQHLQRFDLFNVLERGLDELDTASSLEDLAARVARSIRRVSGYDRVMIYRFEEDGHGHVFAEDVNPERDLEPFLGLHYPASDIPKQVRALFLRKRLRMLPDAKYDYAEGAIVPAENPRTGAALDMTLGSLRGSSPMYTEYLENMGVRATLTLALTKGHQLWGLIACHHYGEPRIIPYDVRIGCAFVARAVSAQLAVREDADRRAMADRMDEVKRGLVARAAETNALDALARSSPTVAELFRANGTAIVTKEAVVALHDAPPEEVIREIAEFAMARPEMVDGIYVTDRLGEEVPIAKEVGVAGLLAVPLVLGAGEVVLWFRPEKAESITWAGDPTKPVTHARFGERLTPRKSFEAWTETVRGRSEPFTALERRVALVLRGHLAEAMAGRARRLREENLALQASNEALDAFAYVASHDLKEPLRGISNYAEFLLEDYGALVDSEGLHMMESLVRLADRMRRLIDALLHFARLGEAPVKRQETPLGLVLDEVRDLLSRRLAESDGSVTEATALPRVNADPTMLLDVLANLISNALKYTDEGRPRVEVGALYPGQEGFPERAMDADVVLYVRDHGIGIPPEHAADVFRIFKRLQAPDAYGGGTGAGLTIVQRIISKHDGAVFFDSRPGETTFYFTLGPRGLA